MKTTTNQQSAWLMAMRLRTLPLALACILLGTLLATADGVANWLVAVLCLITAVSLQILSNLANDYGDSIHGADHTGRMGPPRAVQSGQISQAAMKQAMSITAVISAVSGLGLLWAAFGADQQPALLLFVVLGAAAIGAAVTYTAGHKPYGYAGLGDMAVLIFFGWVGVCGSYFLQAHTLPATLFLPATSCGLMAVAVLNVNNIRDLESDKKAGKHSIPVRLGPHGARLYHWGLLLGAVATAVLYTLLPFSSFTQWLFLLLLPLVWRNGTAVSRAQTPAEVMPLLKQTVQLALLFVLAFGLCQLL